MDQDPPHRPLSSDGDQGVPAEDAERLQQWLAEVPLAIAWLRQQTGLDLDFSPESLRSVWAWAIDDLARADLRTPTSLQEIPAWARWRPYRQWAQSVPTSRLWLRGALVAYFGEVLIARAAAPPMQWRILRHPSASMGGQGELVLLRPVAGSGGKRYHWITVVVIVGIAIGAQAAQQGPHPRVGYNNPDRLQELLFRHLQRIGDHVPELGPPEPWPGIDLEDSLARWLDAPGLAAARAACPARWVGVPEGLDDDDLTFTTEEVCAEVGFGDDEDGDWSIFLHDSIRPVVDVEIPDEQDALLGVLRAHPQVVWAEQTDREIYEWGTTGEPDEEQMAALALTALAAAQEQALHRARGHR